MLLKKLYTLLPEHKRLEWYPPWWSMRVKVLTLENNWRKVRIKLPLTWMAKNMGGSMFGGSQASLADPIAPLACAKLFPGFHVWTRHLTIDFQKPGDTDLELRFDFPPEQEALIREELESKGRSNPSFEYGLYTTNHKLCTKIVCVVAIRPPDFIAKK